MSTRPLTIRGVKQMLTRAGFDTSELTFERCDRSAVHDGGSYAGQYVECIEIRITGPEATMLEAGAALLLRGLSVIPCGTVIDVSR